MNTHSTLTHDQAKLLLETMIDAAKAALEQRDHPHELAGFIFSSNEQAAKFLRIFNLPPRK